MEKIIQKHTCPAEDLRATTPDINEEDENISKRNKMKYLRHNKTSGLRTLPILPNNLLSVSNRFSYSSPDVRSGRTSADSAYFESAYDGEDRSWSVTSERRTPGAGRLSPASSKRWCAAVDCVRKKRQKTAKEKKKKTAELEFLKVTLEQCQAKSRTLEVEVEPLKETKKRYEALIEELEDKLDLGNQEILRKEKSYNSQLLQLERQNQKLCEREKMQRFEFHNKETEELRQLEIGVVKWVPMNKGGKILGKGLGLSYLHAVANEKEAFRLPSTLNKLLRKEVEELHETIMETNSNIKHDNENDSNMRSELMNVRQILEASEHDRLSERKEKLLALQNMIRLTKQNADLEEELSDRRRADTQENSDKYIKLFDKYKLTMEKMKKEQEESVQEKEKLHQKYLNETRNLMTQHEQERNALKASLDEITIKRERTMEDLHLEEVKDIFEIMDLISKGGLYKEGTSAKDMLTNLFNQYQHLHRRLETATEILENSDKSDIRPIVEVLKDEKRQLRCKLEVTEEKLAKKDSELQFTEATFKRQIDELLSEKKNAYLEMQKARDNADTHKDDLLDLQGQLENTKDTLIKRVTELTTMRENLMGVANELKTVDANLVKTKCELATKDAEIMHLNKYMCHEHDTLANGESQLRKLSNEVEEKRKSKKENEKKLAIAETRIHQLEEVLQATKLQVDRISLERDNLQNSFVELQGELSSKEMKIRQFDNLIQSVKNQNTALENSLKEKIKLLSSTSLKLDHTNTELLATQHLLSEEETKTFQQEEDFEQLNLELDTRGNFLQQLQQKNKHLDIELRNLRDKLDNIEVNYQDTESSLRENSSTKILVEKELSLLQARYNELSHEKQHLLETHGVTKQTLDGQTENSKSLKDKLTEMKKEVIEKNRKINELTTEIEKQNRDKSYLEAEYNDLKSNVGSKKAASIQLNNECIYLKDQAGQLTQQKDDLIGLNSCLREEIDTIKLNTEKERKELQKENLKLKKDINEATMLMTDIEGPIQEVIQENALESGVDMFADFDMFDEKPEENKKSSWDLAGTLQDVVRRIKNAEGNAKIDEEKHWKDSLVKDNQIEILKTQLDMKENEKQSLENQIQLLEEKALKDPIKMKLSNEREEKSEAIKCLKDLVSDNEALTHCILELQRKNELQKKENQDFQRKLNSTLAGYEEQQDVLIKTKEKLKDVMHTSLTRESNISLQQKQEIEALKKDFDALKREKHQLQLQLHDKDYELLKTMDDLNALKGAIEYNLGSMEAEKRSKDFVEDQLKLIIKDRGHTLQKLQSSELVNKMLQVVYF